jgi:hypothetical protein
MPSAPQFRTRNDSVVSLHPERGPIPERSGSAERFRCLARLSSALETTPSSRYTLNAVRFRNVAGARSAFAALRASVPHSKRLRRLATP